MMTSRVGGHKETPKCCGMHDSGVDESMAEVAIEECLGLRRSESETKLKSTGKDILACDSERVGRGGEYWVCDRYNIAGHVVDCIKVKGKVREIQGSEHLSF
jgi:hypothetical protein